VDPHVVAPEGHEMKKSMEKKWKLTNRALNNGVTGRDFAQIMDTVLDRVDPQEEIRSRMGWAYPMKVKEAKIVGLNADHDAVHQGVSLPVTTIIADPAEDHAAMMAKEVKAEEKMVPALAPVTADVCREIIPEQIVPLKVRERGR